ncbi:MAG: ligand-binding sensor domain-containing protein [Myxococcota bacterium]|jgi:ligand-binding sensor domain-containing protein
MLASALHVALSTAQVSDLYWDGDRLWAATGGGVEVYSGGGARLGHEVTGLPRSAVLSIGAVGDQIVAGTEDGALAYEAPGQWRQLTETPTVAILPEGAMSRSGWLSPLDGGRAADFRPPSAAPISDAVSVGGVIVTGTLTGEVLVYGDQLHHVRLPGAVVDLSVTGEGVVRVALSTGAAEVGLDGTVTMLPIAASGAGPLWGTADGRLYDEGGMVGRVPAPVLQTVALSAGVFAVATPAGLYRLGAEGLARLTPQGQICGNFITGLVRWQGSLVAATFRDGVCLQGNDGRWRRLEGLPSELYNAALVDGEDLLLASSEGLVRVAPDGSVSVMGVADPEAGRSAPGLHHRSVTGLARGDRLWITDLAGPIAVDERGRWRRYRYHLWSTSSQRVAACGPEAWVATEDAGVSWFDGGEWQHFDALTGLPDDWIMAVACDGRSAGYAGTYQDGVWHFDGEGWQELEGLEDPWVLSLLPVEGAGLWAGTMGGLYRWSGGAWSDAIAGLPDQRIHTMMAEGDVLWIGTEGGLARLRQE